ncbi:MAG: competence/damage-inducible protein A [Bacteroidia bacterium]|nr:competence/damage-inducible protein A [Bacteroidia bacterium]
MNAEIITIGDELLLGQVIDTNSAWMGLKLADIGVSITRRTAIGDDKTEILTAVAEAQSRVALVLLTGGLGPTRDDITKNTLCEYYSCQLRRDTDVLAHLTQIFEKRGRQMLEVNIQQADVPEICTTLFNATGTAPGMLFHENNKVLVSLPGVPSEMKHIMEEHVLPYVQTQFKLPFIKHKTMLTSGIPESLLAHKLTDIEDALPPHIKLAYLPNFNSIRLRLTGKSNNQESLELEIDQWYDKIAEICGENLVAHGDADISTVIAEHLIKNNVSIALAESCTGGFITNQLIKHPGISSVMRGGLVSYSNEIKMQELGVSADILNTVGAVSEACAKAMVEGIRTKFNADIAISTTGIAGPGGATPEKPVGLIYIGIANREKTIVKQLFLHGNREQFMQRACTAALDLVRQLL